jgi:hypothetical protein
MKTLFSWTVCLMVSACMTCTHVVRIQAATKLCKQLVSATPVTTSNCSMCNKARSQVHASVMKCDCMHATATCYPSCCSLLTIAARGTVARLRLPAVTESMCYSICHLVGFNRRAGNARQCCPRSC